MPEGQKGERDETLRTSLVFDENPVGSYADYPVVPEPVEEEPQAEETPQAEEAPQPEPPVAEPLVEVVPRDTVSMRELLGPYLPTAAQVASALAMMALLSPAALGGMPVLPVTIEEDRRRRQDEIQQISESSVGIHHDSQEAQASLTLSQRRLAAVTREVEHSTAHDVTEQDVVHAAHLVVTGEATFGQQLRFRSALGRVANDSVDLFILSTDEAKDERQREQEALLDEEEDLDAWLSEFA